MPVLAVWLNGALYFNAKGTTRKAKNLAVNPHCIMAVGDDTFDLMVEGDATRVRDEAKLRRAAALFASKYPWWHPTVHAGAFYPDDPVGSRPTCTGLLRRSPSASARRRG